MVLRKDESTDWIQLKDVKDSKLVEVTECVVENCIQDEPAFAWWVSKVLRRRNCIISKVKYKYWRMTRDFGV